MAFIHAFDGTKIPTSIILSKPTEPIQSVTFRFYLLSSPSNNFVFLLSSKLFKLSLGYFNSLYLKIKDSSILISDQVPNNYWNTVTIEPNKDTINSRKTSIKETISLESLRYINLGNEKLVCLIETPTTNKYPEFNEPTEPYYEIGIPVPLRSLDEVIQWNGFAKGNKSRVPLSKIEKKHEKELLSCHDCGPSNYKLDIGINDNPCTYRYFHWARTDIFIYFSHERVTIPPVGWTETAHRNATLSIGTFITEWSPGFEENKKLLENGDYFAQKLVDIMDFHGFDGYLINIESDLENPFAMAEWLELLTTLAHSKNPNSQIIWYDSVTIEGKVRWQSQLNGSNSIFFDACDGFFTDYHWTKGMSAVSAYNAGQRKWKVYTGTDVCGRGTYGGGEYNTKIGVEHSSETSTALFAPGWTWEGAGHKEYNGFMSSEKLMWAENSTIIIDSGGVVYSARPKLNKENTLNDWKVYLCEQRPGFRNPNDMKINGLNEYSDGWKLINEKNKLWQVNDDLSTTAGFICTARVATVDVTSLRLGKIDYVSGSVEVLGTGPNFADLYIVKLEVITRKGEVFYKHARGNASDQWQSILLEITANDIVKVNWYEIGKDAEFWNGFYGSRFKHTYVTVKCQGDTLLDNFEIRTHKDFVSTWFNEGQGPCLYRKGEVLKNSTWNSIQDCDLIPDFKIIASNPFSKNNVYHGTSALSMNPGQHVLFNTNFDTSDTNVKIVYKGEVKLLIDDLVPLEQVQEKGWVVESFKHSGKVNKIEVLTGLNSFIGGIHFFNDFPEYKLNLVHKKCLWNIKSLDNDLVVFDVEIEIFELPVFIRHLDVFVNDTFVTRAYSVFFVVNELLNRGDLILRIDAEDLKGDVVHSIDIPVLSSEVQDCVPL